MIFIKELKVCEGRNEPQACKTMQVSSQIDFSKGTSTTHKHDSFLPRCSSTGMSMLSDTVIAGTAFSPAPFPSVLLRISTPAE